jgi:antitoxin (DNA-binding transcriptional repressor) of toxin-antitoxin stability system
MKKQVRIAELKAHLSEYLRAAQRGQTIFVLDRDTPIAQITPLPAIKLKERKPKLIVRHPASGSLPLNRVPLPKPANLDFDIVDWLLEDRRKR